MLFILVAACSQSGPQSSSAINVSGDTTHIEAANLYALNCAGCHGTDLGGNSATALIKENWKYGRTRSLMFRNVKFGIDQTEMAGFANLLSDKQIGSLIDYVWDMQDNPVNRKVIIPDFIETEDYRVKIDQMGAEDLEVPWSIEFVDEKTALISERKGQLRWLVNGELDPTPISGTPKTHTGTSTGGYMDLALDPDYQTNGWVYLAYSHSKANFDDDSEPATTAVIRGRIREHQWMDEQVLFLAPDSLWVTEGNRWGCRLLFDQKKHLYFSIGDMARAMDSQDPGKVCGKIYRIHSDGSIPADNPFVNSDGALEAVFSLGNRNVQGFSVHPETKQIWFSEHGPMGGDEINVLSNGANYGWPVITYGKDYSGEVVSTKTHQPGMEQPVHQWTPSIGVCPIEFVQSDQFSSWNNHLLVGALAFEELQRLEIEGNDIVRSEMLLKGMGRVRDIKTAPDGFIYVVLNSPDLVLRLHAADQPAN
jgi:glucose/arabinose dehydrogenase